jgi:hypothetical protein
MATDLADLLSEVLTLSRLPDIDLAIALDWYKIPDYDIDSRDWPNTLVGTLVHTGKYSRNPAPIAKAGRMLARRVISAACKHPILSKAEVVVAPPGHDRSYLSFGERLGASVANGLGVPLAKVATRHEFRPPAKELPRGVDRTLTGEFSLTEDLTGAAVLIVDDVLRAGTTLSAVGSAAKGAGAARVYGLIAVRTIRSN